MWTPAAAALTSSTAICIALSIDGPRLLSAPVCGVIVQILTSRFVPLVPVLPPRHPANAVPRKSAAIDMP
ncbi:MAG: hypothetical protein ACYDCK_08245 [Thermoplasmatota archaeon]